MISERSQTTIFIVPRVRTVNELTASSNGAWGVSGVESTDAD